MKTFSELLTSKYLSFVNEADDLIFFSGLADYAALIINRAELEPIIRDLAAERDATIKAWEDADARANEALLVKRDEIKKVAEKGADDAELKAIDGEIQLLIDGKMSTTQSPAEYTFHHLHDYCLRVQEMGGEHLLKKYGYVQENGYFKTYFDKLLEEPRRLKKKLDEQRNDSLWGALNHLLIAREIVFEASEKLDEFAKNEFALEGMNYYVYTSAMKRIREGTMIEREFNPFPRKDFKIYIHRVHHFLMEKLLVLEGESQAQKEVDLPFKLEYDLEGKFEVWIKGEPNRRWSMKRGEEFSNVGKALLQMLQNPDQPVLPNSEVEQDIKYLKTSLARGLNRKSEEVKQLFIRKDNFWGIKKSYLSR